MFWEEPRVPGLPGAEDVTDGSVDYYDTDMIACIWISPFSVEI